MATHITTREAAQILGVNDQTVRRWCREQRIESRLDASGWYKIPIDAVNRIAENPRAFRNTFAREDTY